MIALDLSIGTIRPLPSIVIPAVLAAINPEGWSGEWATGTPPAFMPDTAPVTIAVARAGHDATGAATIHAGTRTFIRRKRNAYPAHATDTATTVALDDYVYATDTIPGVTNNSTETSPLPIAAWVMPSRLLVGNVVHWEAIAFHRNFRLGRQVACVRVRANDGTTQTAWQVVATTAISTLCEDANPVEVYAGDLDVSGLATGAFWLEAEVFPWIGSAASVLRSEDLWAAGAGVREFTRRYFHRDAARAAAPPLAYAASTGNDTTGVWSTSPTTAAATPFLTVAGAVAAITNATRGTPATGGKSTGCRIRIVDAVSTGAGATGAAQGGAGIVVERAPGTARAAATATLAGNLRLNMTSDVAGIEPHLTFYDMTLVHATTTHQIYGEAGVPIGVQFWNMTLSDTAAGSRFVNAHYYLFGVAFPNAAWLSQSGVVEMRMTRGVTTDLNGQLSIWVIVGSNISRVLTTGGLNRNKGMIVYANRFLQQAATPITIAGAAAGDTVTGIAIVQNLFEITGTGNFHSFTISNDNLNGNTLHSVIAHNSCTGFNQIGRLNVFYDESTGTNRRTHRLMRMVGNILVAINVKGDVFYAGTSTSEAPNRTGHLAFVHGVGSQGNFTQFCSADGGQYGSAFAMMYPGPGSVIGASATVRLDPSFTDYRGTAGETTAGTTGGVYTLQPGSNARGRVTARGLGFDLAGNARPAGGADAAGAYA